MQILVCKFCVFTCFVLNFIIRQCNFEEILMNISAFRTKAVVTYCELVRKVGIGAKYPKITYL